MAVAATVHSPTGTLETAPRTFWGFRRGDGQIGIRNHLLIVPATTSANTVARRVAALIPGAIALPVLDDDAEVPHSRALTERTLAGAAASPNAGASIVIGLSHKDGEAERVLQQARALAPDKPIEAFSLDQTGGSVKAIAHGVELGQKLMARLALHQREEASVAELMWWTSAASPASRKRPS
jgi:altronate dehydratase large subunit